MYLHPKNQLFQFQKRRNMFCLHHFQAFTRGCFKIVPVMKTLPFSKSAGKKYAVFLRIGVFSVTFFTVFKKCRNRVNAVSVGRRAQPRSQGVVMSYADREAE